MHQAPTPTWLLVLETGGWGPLPTNLRPACGCGGPTLAPWLAYHFGHQGQQQQQLLQGQQGQSQCLIA